MSESNHIKNYSAADFERYYSGKMPEQEMHALEKAALGDPFLADALEGYANTQTASEDMVLLKEKFDNRSKKEIPIVALPKRNTTWIKAAAILIFVAFSGYFLLRKNSKENDNLVLAKNTESTLSEEKEKANTQPVHTDSIVVSGNNKTTITINPSNVNATTAAGTLQTDEQTVNFADVTTKDVENKKPANNDLHYTVPANNGYINQNNQGVTASATYQWQTNDSSSKLVTGAILKEQTLPGKLSADDYYKANLDTSKYRRRFGTDSLMLASKDGKYDPGRAYNIDPRQMNQGILKVDADKKQELNEVVVTGYDAKRKLTKAKLSAASISKVSIGAFSDSISTPVNGWADFKQYVQNNRITAPGYRADSMKGKVILSFKVNKAGSPVKIRVEKHLNAVSDEEAIRLLRNGPKWKYAGGKRLTVDIDF